VLATIALMTGSALLSHGDVISIPPEGVSSSSEIPGFDRIDDYLVDESGLFDGEHDIIPDGGMWLSSGTAFGGDDLEPFVMFDFGAVYTITSFHVWNYNEGGAFALRGVDGVSNEHGTTEALGSTVPGITNFEIALGEDGDTGEEFDGFAPFSARFIKFAIVSNHRGDNNFYGLSEVQFHGTLGSVGFDFAITNVEYDKAGPSVKLTFNSHAGKTYALDSSTDQSQTGSSSMMAFRLAARKRPLWTASPPEIRRRRSTAYVRQNNGFVLRKA
jgi:hypothetical protein